MHYHAFKYSESKDIHLDPCPFCGGIPEWVTDPGDDLVVRCSQCHASTPQARMTSEEAAKDWNSKNVFDDHYSITEDIHIDKYFEYGIQKILFIGDFLQGFLETDHGFRCDDLYIFTDNVILSVESEFETLHYDEVMAFDENECACEIKTIGTDGEEIQFVHSIWQDNILLSLKFVCGNRQFTISGCKESNYRINVCEEINM